MIAGSVKTSSAELHSGRVEIRPWGRVQIKCALSQTRLFMKVLIRWLNTILDKEKAKSKITYKNILGLNSVLDFSLVKVLSKYIEKAVRKHSKMVVVLDFQSFLVS